MMNEKKYQLAAWTKNVDGNTELRLIPSLHYEMQKPYIDEISRLINMKDANDETIRKAVNAYERNADFLLSTGHKTDGIRMLRQAALYCVRSYDDDRYWIDYDTDLGSYSHYAGKLNDEFIRLVRRIRELAEKCGRQDILMEKESRYLKSICTDMFQEEDDFERHLDEMRAWM